MTNHAATSPFSLRILAVLVLALAGLPLGCIEDEEPPPVVGEWRSPDDVGGNHNELEIDDDLEGEAVLFAYYDGGLYEFPFEVEVERDGDEWRFEMQCDGCSDFDFRMVCEFDNGDMECEGDQLWEEYVFEWEPD